MKNFKKNLLISIKRSLRENEVALGVSLGLLIACIGLLIMHIQNNKDMQIHAAPPEVIDEYYEAPGRAITIGNKQKTGNQNEISL